MDHKENLQHKKQEIMYEMNAVKHYIDDQDCDEQLKDAWDKDQRQLRRLDRLLGQIEEKEHRIH